MRSEGLNKAITISNAEREALVNSLISAGINEKIVKDALSPVAAGETCGHVDPTCGNIFAVNPDALGKLKQEIKNKGIDIQKIDPAIKKLMQ